MSNLKNAGLNYQEVKERKCILKSSPLSFNYELTGRCNINPPCVFCVTKANGDGIYPPLTINHINTFDRFIADADIVNDCSIGEPLSHKDFSLLLKKFNSNEQIFSFTTNGLLLNKENRDALIESKASINFNVSLNAATPETYYKITGNNFNIVVSNIKKYINEYFVKKGKKPEIRVSMVVLKVNKDEVNAFIELAKELGAVSALLARPYVYNFDPPERNDFGYTFKYSEQRLSDDEYFKLAQTALNYAKKIGFKLEIGWLANEDSPLGGMLFPDVSTPCMFPFKFILARAHDKKAIVCCYNGGAVGDLEKNTIEEIWNGDIIVSLRKSLNRNVIPEWCWKNHHGCPLILKALAEGTNEIVMGINDAHYLTSGWHELETSEYNNIGQFRWTSKVASFKLKVNKNAYLCIQCARIWPVNAQGYIVVEGEKIGSFSLPNDFLRTLRILLPNNIEGNKEFKIVITNWQKPCDFDSNSQDTRELGVMVSKIWMEDSCLLY